MKYLISSILILFSSCAHSQVGAEGQPPKSIQSTVQMSWFETDSLHFWTFGPGVVIKDVYVLIDSVMEKTDDSVKVGVGGYSTLRPGNLFSYGPEKGVEKAILSASPGYECIKPQTVIMLYVKLNENMPKGQIHVTVVYQEVY